MKSKFAPIYEKGEEPIENEDQIAQETVGSSRESR
jgi:hypothetical protein